MPMLGERAVVERAGCEGGLKQENAPPMGTHMKAKIVAVSVNITTAISHT